MATITSAANGNWSNTATWVGGVVPTSVDTVRINGHTVDADVDIDVAVLEYVSNSLGQIRVSTNRTITVGTVDTGVQNNLLVTTQGVIVVTASVGSTVTVNVSEVLIPSVNLSRQRPIISTSGTAHLIYNGILRTIGHTATHAIGMISLNVANSQLTVNGIVYGSIGGAPTYAIATTAINCTVNLNAVIVGGVNSVFFSSLAVTVNIPNGILTSGAVQVLEFTGAATVNFNGVATSSASAPVITSTNISSVVNFQGTIVNTNNTMAIYCIPTKIVGSVNWLFQSETIGVSRYLYTADELTGYPIESKVEDGTIYGPSSEFEGTLSPVNVNTQQLAEDLITELFNNGTPWATPQFVTAAITAITPAP